MPSHAVSIRAIEAVRYKVIDIHKDDVLEEIEESKAFFQVVKLQILICIMIFHLKLVRWTL